MESIIHFRKQWITVMIQGVLLQSFVSYLKYKVKLNSNQHVGDIFGIYVMLDRWSLESHNFHITMKVSTYIKYRFWKKINKCESFIESLVLLFSFFFTLFFYVYCSVTSVVSDSVRPFRQQPTRLPHLWDSPGKNTGVGCHFLSQCRKVKSESKVSQSCPTLSDPMDCSLPGSSVQWDFPGKSTRVGCHCPLHFLCICVYIFICIPACIFICIYPTGSVYVRTLTFSISVRSRRNV